jgi:hypothetical protein
MLSALRRLGPPALVLVLLVGGPRIIPLLGGPIGATIFAHIVGGILAFLILIPAGLLIQAIGGISGDIDVRRAFAGTPLATFSRKLSNVAFISAIGFRLSTADKRVSIKLPRGGTLEIKRIDGPNERDRIEVAIRRAKGDGATGQYEELILVERTDDSLLEEKIHFAVAPHLLHEPKLAMLCAEATEALIAFAAGKPAKVVLADGENLTAIRPEDALSGARAHAKRLAERDEDETVRTTCSSIAKALDDVETLAGIDSARAALVPIIDHVIPNLRIVLDGRLALAAFERKDLVADAMKASTEAIVGAAAVLDAKLRNALSPVGSRVADTARMLEFVSNAVDPTGSDAIGRSRGKSSKA